MGRGLSELQKKILIYATEPGRRRFDGTVRWLDSMNPAGRARLAGQITGRSEWTGSDSPVISRALRRLEERQLVKRVTGPLKARTWVITVTPEGVEAAEQLRKGNDLVDQTRLPT